MIINTALRFNVTAEELEGYRKEFARMNMKKISFSFSVCCNPHNSYGSCMEAEFIILHVEHQCEHISRGVQGLLTERDETLFGRSL